MNERACTLLVVIRMRTSVLLVSGVKILCNDVKIDLDITWLVANNFAGMICDSELCKQAMKWRCQTLLHVCIAELTTNNIS